MSRTINPSLACLAGLLLLMASPAPWGGVARAAGDSDRDASLGVSLADEIQAGIARIVAMEEGENRGEWPYEGVYRVREGGKTVIPIGYRVGGTSICCSALIQAPGYDADNERQQAVKRGVAFVTGAITHPLMSEEDYDGTYDVRGWGYIYGAGFLIRLQNMNLVPAGMEQDVQKACEWYLEALQKIEMPQTGGWNYARPAGRDTVGAPSTFMTAPALQVLFEARKAGYTVDDAIVERGLDYLESARRDSSGEFVYSGSAGRNAGGVPGAMGRMLSCETTLHLAGRADGARIRGAVDAFFIHWDELEVRRRQNGTHIPPYSVAPYYFFFAHYYCAQAIEQLPNPERTVYRKKLAGVLDKIRQDDGTWNDRVFDRSANYGTSMAVMALMMPELAKPAEWAPRAAPAGEARE